MAAPGEKEVFRIIPTIGKCYEWGESTRSSGGYPNERRFAPEQNVIYVGKLVNVATGGYGDGGWRTDTFINRETGIQTQVPYSYSGRTCFIEVSCSDKMSRAMAAGRIKRTRNVRKNKITKRRKTKKIRNKKKYKLAA